MSIDQRAKNVHYSVPYLVGILADQGLLTDEQASQVRSQESTVRTRIMRERVNREGTRKASRTQVSPAEVVADFNFVAPNGKPVDHDAIAQAIANDAGVAFEKPDPLEVDMKLVANTVSQPFARHHSCIPLRRENGKIVFALDNPFDQQLIMQLREVTSEPLEIVVSPKEDIAKLIVEVYGFSSSITAAEQEVTGGVDIGNLEQLVRLKNVGEIEATDRPIINAVEYLLHYAFDQRASDIHIEPKREHTMVRLRIDGVLHNIYQFPKAIHRAFTSRMKMLARMDISERRRPQDGRIKTEREGREVELRVSSMPVAFGEKLVIRIFDPQSIIKDLSSVGMTDEETAQWREFIHRPHGMVLVTGPTGSGKTTTLYSTLKELAGPDVNITTIEDPIEMVQEDLNQVLVQKRVDITFASALRTILRQDPDIIMVGEIRDPETAQMAAQAALTGHLVFSTLHTNDTASTVTRLLDLEVEPFLLSSTLVGVMAQRLVRRICTSCKAKTTLDAEQVELLDIKLPPRSQRTLPAYYGEGCTKCRGTGYFGRTGLFEMLPVDTSIAKLISRQADAPEIRKAARANGMMSLREGAIRKLAKGETTFEEVMTVCAES
ncbi:type II/IV secretion system protein [Persicimonas caeni]|uniref:Type II/IV secretion system protein n=2 Tax=Persicimonas caeni TaxID=2292766 RepID=A0A4Y6PYD5_PERCE|nr:GspE/PulE family protein [Persicimonas caeni]QDG53321.1 type II/IV secretion system protein [Persicimonas caeni]QED36162.1 type II/IV secretion system protein [Persicimonas caeni]